MDSALDQDLYAKMKVEHTETFQQSKLVEIAEKDFQDKGLKKPLMEDHIIADSIAGWCAACTCYWLKNGNVPKQEQVTKLFKDHYQYIAEFKINDLMNTLGLNCQISIEKNSPKEIIEFLDKKGFSKYLLGLSYKESAHATGLMQKNNDLLFFDPNYGVFTMKNFFDL